MKAFAINTFLLLQLQSQTTSSEIYLANLGFMICTSVRAMTQRASQRSFQRLDDVRVVRHYVGVTALSK